MKTEHTPTPRFRMTEVPALDKSGAIAHEIETDGHTVAHVYPDSGDDYAAFIVTACNSHADLLEALEQMLNQVTGPAQVYGDGVGSDGRKTGLSHWEFNALRDERIEFARTTLAKAKEGAR